MARKGSITKEYINKSKREAPKSGPQIDKLEPLVKGFMQQRLQEQEKNKPNKSVLTLNPVTSKANTGLIKNPYQLDKRSMSQLSSRNNFAPPSNRLEFTPIGEKTLGRAVQGMLSMNKGEIKPYQLDKRTMSQLSNAPGRTVSDKINHLKPNRYEGLEFTPKGEEVLLNGKFGQYVTKPMMAGAYENQRAKALGRTAITGRPEWNDEAVKEYGKLAEKYAPEVSGNKLGRGVQSVSTLMGQMASSQITPGMFTPVGQAVRGAEMMAGMTGRTYESLINDGVSDDKARQVATVVGSIMGGIEKMQIDEIVGSVGTIGKIGNKSISNSFIQAVTKSGKLPALERALGSKLGHALARSMAMTATGTGEEVLQEITQIAGENIAKKSEGIRTDTGREVANRLKDTALQSAGTFGLMNVPGFTMDIIRPHNAQVNQGVQGRPNIADSKGIMADDINTGATQQPEVQTQPVKKPSQIASPPVQNTEYVYDEKSYEDLYNYINSKQEPIIPKKTTPEERIQAFHKDVKDKKEWPVFVRISKEKFNKAMQETIEQIKDGSIDMEHIHHSPLYKAIKEHSSDKGMRALSPARNDRTTKRFLEEVRNMRFRVDSDVKKDRPDFGLEMRDLFGDIKFIKGRGANVKGAWDIENAYTYLTENFPGFIKLDIWNKQDQFAAIVDAVREAKETMNGQDGIHMYIDFLADQVEQVIRGIQSDMAEPVYAQYIDEASLESEGFSEDYWGLIADDEEIAYNPEQQKVWDDIYQEAISYVGIPKNEYMSMNQPFTDINPDQQKVLDIAQKLYINMEYVTFNDNRIQGQWDGQVLRVNAQAQAPLYTVLMHELTHVIEGTVYYNDMLNEAIKHLERKTGRNIVDIVVEQPRAVANHGFNADYSRQAQAEVMADYMADLLGNEENLQALARQNGNLAQRIYQWLSDIIQKLSNEDTKILINARQQLGKALNDVADNRIAKPQDSQSLFLGETASKEKVYQNFAGEIEAREVQKRMDMTDEERRNTVPYLGADEAIVTFDHSTSLSSQEDYFPEQIKDVNNKNPQYSNDIHNMAIMDDAQDPKKVSRLAKRTADSELYNIIGDSLQDKIKSGELDYTVIGDKPSVERAKEKLKNNRAEQLAYDFMAKADANKRITKDDAVTAIGTIQKLVTQGQTELAEDLVSSLSLSATEAGQFIQSLKLLEALSPMGMLKATEKAIGKMNKGKDYTMSDARKEDILNQTTPDGLKGARERAVGEYISSRNATLMEIADAWRYLAMLMNPKTHGRNFYGNALFAIPKGAKNIIGGATEGIVEALGGFQDEERTKTLKRSDTDTKKFAKADFEVMKNTYLHGNSKENLQNRNVRLPRGLSTLSNLNTNALENMDIRFMKHHYTIALANYLTANKIDVKDLGVFGQNAKGERIVEIGELTPENKKILDKARNYAITEAKKATYRDYNSVASVLNELKRKNPYTKFAMDAVFPFVSTPLNIVKRGVEYSPVGLANGLKKLAQKARKTDSITTSEVIDTIASGLSGTGVFALGAFLASRGLLSGGDEEDKKVANLLGLEGEQVYSINLGDYTYSLDWMAPLSMPLFMGVEFFNQSDDGSGSFTRIVDSLTKISDPLIQLSVLTGLNRLVSSAKWSDNSIGSIMSEAIAGYANQYIPTFSGQVARTIDDTRRTKYFDKNEDLPKFAKTIKANTQAKIPLWSQDAPAYIDSFGRTQKTGDSVLSRAVQNMISPGFIREKSNDPVTKGIREMYDSTKDSSILPPLTVRRVTVDKKQIDFTPKEYTDFNTFRGQTTYSVLDKMQKSQAYKQASDDERAQMLSKVYDYSNQLAKEKYFGYSPQAWVKDVQNSPVGGGEGIALYLSQKENKESRKELKQQGKIEDMENPFENLSLTGEERNKYILSTMPDIAQRQYKLANQYFGMNTDDYYKAYYAMTTRDNRSKKKDESIRDLMKMGFNADGANLFWDFHKKKKWK